LSGLQSLFSWRDAIARKEDESTGYILPNHLLVQLGMTIESFRDNALALLLSVGTPLTLISSSVISYSEQELFSRSYQSAVYCF
jgi:hypothetical protein